MKIYTLDFDCNQPTAQQVNVPTNTDYKIGIKVSRNGEIQSLSPDSVKLYTGESTEIEPTEFDFVAKAASSGGFLMSYNETSQTDISSLYSQTVKCTDLYIESSTDDGTTWTKTVPTGTQWMRINDRSAGTNNYVAQKELSDPDSKFELTDSSGIYGYAKEIELPSVVRFSGNFNTDFWGNTTFPCKMRLVIKYGGYSYPVYIEPDAVKTNGYVTFTLSSDDNASYTSEKLGIEKGYDFDDTISYSAGPAQSGDRAIFLSSEYSAEQVGLAGLELKIDDIKWGYNTAGATQLTVADITEWNEAKTYIGSQWHFFKWPNGNAALIFQSNNPTAFGWFSEDGTQAAWKEKVTIDPRWILSFGGNGTGNRTTVGKYWVVAYKFKIGTPWSANFKLNTNVFKSQQGDIADGIESASTAKLVGKFADGTDFDYNLVIV